MKRALRWVFFLGTIAAVVVAPLVLTKNGGVAPQVAATDKIVPILAAFLVSTALLTALYTSFSNDNRLRANSGNVLVALICVATAILVLAVALLLTAVGATGLLLKAAQMITYIAIMIYFLTFLYLLLGVFLPTYNQVYNLRTNKLFKYFPPIQGIRGLFARDKRYDVTPPHKRDNIDFACLKELLSEQERAQLGRGGAVLISGAPTQQSLIDLLGLLEERIEAGETVNYICCDRHPYEIWSMWKDRHGSNHDRLELRRKNTVFVDAYSPSFAFTDDIQKENDKLLRDEGIPFVKARTFAGLHTAVNQAFNIVKTAEVKTGRNVRRPQTMIYAHTSALCDFESVEQFRVFWRHVIPSERSYGMTTVLVEDEFAGTEILGALKQRVDFVVNYERDPSGQITKTREK